MKKGANGSTEDVNDPETNAETNCNIGNAKKITINNSETNVLKEHEGKHIVNAKKKNEINSENVKEKNKGPSKDSDVVVNENDILVVSEKINLKPWISDGVINTKERKRTLRFAYNVIRPLKRNNL